MKITKGINRIKKQLIFENNRDHIQFLTVFSILELVAVFMTVLNIFSPYEKLMYITLTFSVLNIINVVFVISRNKVLEKISKYLFVTEVILMLTAFIITGEPEGFSVIWSVMIPMVSLILFKRKDGTIISAIMLIILIFLFWIPIGRDIVQKFGSVEGESVYTETFMARFPIVYIAFYFLGLFFESVRAFTYEELVKVKERYKKMSLTDQLTGLGNETAYFKMVERLEKKMELKTAKYALVLMDVNGVKNVNDEYGHRYGCNLIVQTGRRLPTIFTESEIFHVGGDEFVVCATGGDYDNLSKRITLFKKELEYKVITYEGNKCVLSVAIGSSKYNEGDGYKDVFQRADKDMYNDKSKIKEKYKISTR